MDVTQMATAVNASVIAVEHNHGDTLRRRNGGLKAAEEEEIDEEEVSLLGHLKTTTGAFDKHDAPTLIPETAKENTPALSIGGESFDLTDHQPNHPGLRKRSLSLTSLYLHEQLEQAETKWKNATNILDKHIAFKTMQTRQTELMARNVHTTTVKAATYAAEKPLHTAAYVAGGLLTVGSAFPAATGVGLPGAAAIGSAGLTLMELAHKDFNITNGKDVADVAAAAALGALPGVRQLKYMLPAAVTVGGYGFATDQEHLMWGGGLTAGFGAAPRVVGWGLNKFSTTQQSFAMQSANKMGSIDDIILTSSVRPAVNSNVPVRPTANHKQMSVAHTLTEASEVNGIQRLARQMNGTAGGSGLGSAKPKTFYVTPHMSDAEVAGLSPSSRNALDIIAGRSGAGTSSSALGSRAIDPSDTLKVRVEKLSHWKEVHAGGASPTSVASGGVNAPKLSTPGGVIRADAIPAGSQLEYLAPGRVRFDGVEFRAVRDLSHLSDSDLIRISKTGVAPRDINGLPIEGHHHLQRYHREPGAFVVEIPEPNHCISNSIQHPLGNSGGLSVAERADWTNLRRAFYKERAKTELLKRSVLNG